MALESQWVVDRSKDQRALSIAKSKNSKKTVPIRVNSYTVAYVTPEQAQNKKFIERMIHRYNHPNCICID